MLNDISANDEIKVAIAQCVILIQIGNLKPDLLMKSLCNDDRILKISAHNISAKWLNEFRKFGSRAAPDIKHT